MKKITSILIISLLLIGLLFGCTETTNAPTNNSNTNNKNIVKQNDNINNQTNTTTKNLVQNGELVGTWETPHQLGKQVLTFESNGNLNGKVLQNENEISNSFGTYSINGNKLYITIENVSSNTEYTYSVSNDTLIIEPTNASTGPVVFTKSTNNSYDEEILMPPELPEWYLWKK